MLTKQKPNLTTHSSSLKRVFSSVLYHTQRKTIKDQRLHLKLYPVNQRLTDKQKDSKSNDC